MTARDGFKKYLYGFIADSKDKAVETLRDLISIDSTGKDPVTTPEGEEYPFGQGVQDAFSYMLSMGESDGFRTFNASNYGGHIEFGPEEDQARTCGILAHLDVVPEGEGWEHAPFSGDIADGYIWGRGTTDDKGPLLASYYAMKAVKVYLEGSTEEQKKRIRLILGLDEETAWEGMYRYFEEAGKPDMGFTPDADFPVLNGEKGVMHFKIAGKLKRTNMKGLVLRKLSGGTAVNMVPGKARAVVNDPDPKMYEKIEELAGAYEQTSGHKLRIRKTGKSLEIVAEGVSAHGSTPEKGVNAISILIGFLGSLNFVNEDISNFFDFYNDRIAFDTEGTKLGCAMSDEPSGKLSLNAGVLDYDGQAISVDVDIRYPVTENEDKVYELMIPAVDKYGLGVLKEGGWKPIYKEKDDPLIQMFLSCYREVTGDTGSEPMVIGGGTYARSCDNIVAFGGLFPGDPDLMHQTDERLSVERFFDMMRIYALAIYDLAVAE